MERNGLDSRKRERKIGLWVCGVSSFFVISFFLVPYYLPTDSVPKLSGRANAFDYYSADSWGNVQSSSSGEVGHNQSEYGYFAWSELDPYAAFIYGFGDLNCHNKAERSWEINGNQMPVCVRDVGIFFGFALGGFLYSRRGLNRWTLRDSFLSIFPDNRLDFVYRNNYRTLALIASALIMAGPMAIDGFTQLLTSYESNATMRMLTGLPFGVFIGTFLAASFAARPEYFGKEPSMVLLPSNTRFSTAEKEQEE